MKFITMAPKQLGIENTIVRVDHHNTTPTSAASLSSNSFPCKVLAELREY
jgi:hypothetical protein